MQSIPYNGMVAAYFGVTQQDQSTEWEHQMEILAAAVPTPTAQPAQMELVTLVQKVPVLPVLLEQGPPVHQAVTPRIQVALVLLVQRVPVLPVLLEQGPPVHQAVTPRI